MRESLSGASLTVGEDGAIIATKYLLYDWASDHIVHIGLRGFRRNNSIEGKGFALKQKKKNVYEKLCSQQKRNKKDSLRTYTTRD